MKQTERLLHILGQVKDEFIEEAAPKERVIDRKALWTKWLATAACLVLIMGIAVPGVIVATRSAGVKEGAAEAPAADAAIEEAAPMEEEAPAAEEEAAAEEEFPPSDEYCVPESTIITADEQIVPEELARKDAWGVALTVKDVTPTRAVLVFAQSGKKTDGELLYGTEYVIEKQSVTNASDWTEVEPIIEEYGWEQVAFSIDRNSVQEFEVDWEWLYGELNEGTYRISKKVSMRTDEENSELEYHTYTAEFIIE